MTIVLAKQRDFLYKKGKIVFFSSLHLGKNIIVHLKIRASEESEEKILDFYA